jgi:hypothetical protein
VLESPPPRADVAAAPRPSAAGVAAARGRDRLERLAPALLAIAALGVGRALRHVALDDPYVTYRYAENLAAGLGPVYNPGERVLSTTALGYALLLSAAHLALPWLDLPAVSNSLSALGLGLTALALNRLCTQHRAPAVGLTAGALVCLSPLLTSTFGLETCLFLALVAWGAVAFDAGHRSRAAFLLAAATALRADGAVAFAVLWTSSALSALDLPPASPLPLGAGLPGPTGPGTGQGEGGTMGAGRGRRPAPALLTAAALYAALVLPYEAALALYYGSPVPTTLAAKTVQATIGAWPDYLGGLRDLLAERVGVSPLYWLAPPLLAVGLAASARRRWALPLVLWALAQAAVYQLLGVASYAWYYAPLVPAAALLIALGAGALASRLAGAWPGRRRPWLAALLTLSLVAPLLLAQARELRALRAGVPEPRALAYQRVGQWLAANADQRARVAVMEVGIMGYYAGRPMVDLLGLIRPETVEAMRRQDFFWTIAESQADLVVLTGKNPLWFQSIEPDHWFNQYYAPVERVDQPGFWGTPLTIFRRVAPPRQPAALDAPGPGRFGPSIALERVALEKTSARPGDFLTAQLFWRALAPVERDYAAFVHVVNAEPRVLAQHDTPIASSRWPVGPAIQYYHPMRLPADLPPGRYRIEVGLYLPEQPLRRLPPLDRPSDRDVAAIAELVVD